MPNFWSCDTEQTLHKNEVFHKDFFSKCDQIRTILRIWSHVLKKSLMKHLIFCAVKALRYHFYKVSYTTDKNKNVTTWNRADYIISVTREKELEKKQAKKWKRRSINSKKYSVILNMRNTVFDFKEQGFKTDLQPRWKWEWPVFTIYSLDYHSENPLADSSRYGSHPLL